MYLSGEGGEERLFLVFYVWVYSGYIKFLAD